MAIRVNVFSCNVLLDMFMGVNSCNWYISYRLLILWCRKLGADGIIATPGALFRLPFHVTWERSHSVRKDIAYEASFLIGWDRSYLTPHQYIENGAHFISYRCAAHYNSDFIKLYYDLGAHHFTFNDISLCDKQLNVTIPVKFYKLNPNITILQYAIHNLDITLSIKHLGTTCQQ